MNDAHDIPSQTYLQHKTGDNPRWSVIWLHGLGADGNDFAPLVPELGFTDRPAVRFLFPHAPIRPITINGGMEMRGWYDITGMAFDREEDRTGMEDSAAIVGRFIARENARGIDNTRIILAGFSQGGAVALHAGLRLEAPVAGILALSTYLPLADQFETERAAASQTVPIFMAHGSQDPVIPLALAERSRDLLVAGGYNVTWHSYPMPHSVSPQEIADIRNFMHRIVT